MGKNVSFLASLLPSRLITLWVLEMDLALNDRRHWLILAIRRHRGDSPERRAQCVEKARMIPNRRRP